MTAPTVFVVDDNPGVRKSIQALVEAAGLRVETYATARDFLAAYDAERAGCLVLDIRLKGESGLDLQDELHARGATLPVIIITGYADVPATVRAFKGGAVDFLRKPVPPKKLVAQILAAVEVDRRAREVASERYAVTAHIAHLTPRERQVMELLAVGKSSKEIATTLAVSARTVEGHRRNVLRKMDVESAVQLARAIAGLRRPQP
jgi:FixJ family two-component response regulator